MFLVIRGVRLFNYQQAGPRWQNSDEGQHDSTSKPVANRSAMIWGLGSVLVVALVINLLSGGDTQTKKSELRTESSTLNASVEPDTMVDDTLLESVVSPSETIEPTWRDIKVRDGDNLSLIFARAVL